jgi:hypothetical protein
MAQLNFRIEDEIDEFVSLMSDLERKSKSSIGKDIFMKGIEIIMLPYLAELYRIGKISIKHISKITHIHPSEVISKVADLIDDIEINPELVQYSAEIAKKMDPFLKQAKENGFSLKGTINIGDED